MSYFREIAGEPVNLLMVVPRRAETLALPWNTLGVLEAILSDNGTVQAVKATMPAGSSGKRFARLRMT